MHVVLLIVMGHAVNKLYNNNNNNNQVSHGKGVGEP
jgi:hypothetical protein